MFCTQCGCKNADGSRFCAKCGAGLVAAAGAGEESVALAPVLPEFPDVSATLPSDVKKRLLSDERAYAYVIAPTSGCGSPPSSLLVTDSRVVLHGTGNPTDPRAGCGQSPRLLDIPL